MNHPLSRQQASELVRRISTHPLLGDSRLAQVATIARIQIMYLELFGRLPDDVEVKFGQEFLQQVVSAESPDTNLKNATVTAQTQAWTEYGHALITTNEFMYIP